MTEDYEMQEFAREVGDEAKPGLLEKTAAGCFGPVLGMLPPPVQRKIASEESAALMSKTSRYVNGLLIPAYAAGCLVARSVGYDIDIMPGNITPWIGLGALINSGIREGFNAIAYVHNHPDVEHLKVWGEPIISMIYNSLFEKKSNPSK